jgi:hypothetical protein
VRSRILQGLQRFYVVECNFYAECRFYLSLGLLSVNQLLVCPIPTAGWHFWAMWLVLTAILKAKELLDKTIGQRFKKHLWGIAIAHNENNVQ